jgi:DNA-binding NtrC family response regulator
VRQLQNIIQRAVILADGHVIRPQDLHGLDAVANAGTARAANEAANTGAGTDTEPASDPFLTGDGHIRRLLDIEGETIARALTLYRGRMAETARRLGIGRSTLYRKIDDLQLDKYGG